MNFLASLIISLCLTATLSVGHVSRTVDGDTFGVFTLDGLANEERVRILGVDAVELRDPLGPVARAFTMEWISRGSFKLEACKRDSFGRLLAIITRAADTLAVDLIRARLGVAR